MKRFHEEIASHECDACGCLNWFIFDSGCKPHRCVCAARYSGYKTYKNSSHVTITGCTKKTAKDERFCSDHKANPGPVVLAENLSSETKRKFVTSEISFTLSEAVTTRGT